MTIVGSAGPTIVVPGRVSRSSEAPMTHGLDVHIVGAGNSGAEIAIEAARGHQVWMSGRDTGPSGPSNA